MSKDKNYENFLKRIAVNIKKLRLENELTQEDMTEYGFNYRHYQNWRVESIHPL